MDPAPTANPARTGSRTKDAERLVFLLQYVGTDYAVAVRDGEVVDESEYEENREFVSLIREKFQAVRGELPQSRVAAISEGITRLFNLVAERGDPHLVREITESLIPEIVQGVGLHAFPRGRPDTRAAATLYAENCVPCHGVRGDGDGPRAQGLDPPPARFSDRARMDSTPPYVFYNAITLGVGNTAMASFADAFSDQQRWDLAFYLWTFVLSDDPQNSESPPASLSLRDLATRPSVDLVPEIRSQASSRGVYLDPTQALLWGAKLRAHPAIPNDARERLVRLRVDLAQSLTLLDKGEFDAAADLVTTSYFSEFEPLEPEIDRRDARVRQAFERNLIEFRAALRRSDQGAAAAAAAKLEQSVDRSAELLAEAGASRPVPIWVVAMCLLLVAGGGIVWWRRAAVRAPEAGPLHD